uniref:Uncharacterized protein n=1 Tax=Echinococcus canadensis TaxID=519352 RepID=A0A915EYB8_9CEST
IDLVQSGHWFLGLSVEVFSLTTIISDATRQLPTDVERVQVFEAHLAVQEMVHPTVSNIRCAFEHPDLRAYPHNRGLGHEASLVSSVMPTCTEGVCG